MSSLQAVLFDMDGTICDTEPAWMAAEYTIAEQHGAQWTQEDALRLVGNQLIVSGRYVKERMGLEQSAEAVVDVLLAEVTTAVRRDGVAWRPGALELLRECNEAAVPTALVTMSYTLFAEAVLTAMPFGRFDTVVTGDVVAHGKPAPDAYLQAAGALGADPARCVAIEDSPTGVASAQAAGCVVMAVPHHVDVPATAGLITRPGLVDVTLNELRCLVADR
ncbi:MAG: HAD family hydrolase [Nocardioidaceae bacterium]